MKVEYKAVLSSETIETFSGQMNQFMEEQKNEKELRMRIRYYVEELLLRMQDRYKDGLECQFFIGKRYGSPLIEIKWRGESYDPREDNKGLFMDDEHSTWFMSQLSQVGLMPAWRYFRGQNRLSLTVRQEKYTVLKGMVYALVGAAVFGGLGLAFLPSETCMFISENILDAAFSSVLGLLTTFAGIMIFLSITTGIYGIGDMNTLGVLGKSVLTRFLLGTFGGAVLAATVMFPFFDFMKGAGGGGNGFLDLLEMVLAIIPSDPITPFLKGDFMQIIVLGAAFGIAALILSDQVPTFRNFLDEANNLVQWVMEKVCGMIPVMVFFMILSQILSGKIGTYVTAAGLLLKYLILFAVVLAIDFFIVSYKHKVSPSLLLKKLFPCFLTGLTTASGVAVFGKNVNTCKSDLGVDSKLTEFGVPMGNVLFMPFPAMSFLLCSFYLAELTGTEVTAPWTIMAIFVAALLGLAMPPIPGGSLTCFGILMSQLAIPHSALASVMGIAVLFDFLGTAGDVAFMQMELVKIAGNLDMLDVDVLRKKTN